MDVFNDEYAKTLFAASVLVFCRRSRSLSLPVSCRRRSRLASDLWLRLFELIYKQLFYNIYHRRSRDASDGGVNIGHSRHVSDSDEHLEREYRFNIPRNFNFKNQMSGNYSSLTRCQ